MESRRTAHSSHRLPELPSLNTGIHLLESDRARGPLHALVLDRALTEPGPVYWIDTHGHATTQPLARLAPDPRVLGRIHVARGFTGFQHYAIVETLVDLVDEDASAVVCPAIDGMYRDGNLRNGEGQEMLVRVLAMLSRLAREYDLPVLLTRARVDELSEPVANLAVDRIECQQTRMGPRFVSDDFETLVYPLGNGQVQTTLAFWEQILNARQPLYESAQIGPQTTEVPAHGSY